MVFNSLAGGFLTGKYQQGRDPEDNTRFGLFREDDSLYRERYWKPHHFKAVEELKKFFGPRNRSLVHVALSWVLHQREVTLAILGASRMQQLRSH